MKTKILKCSRCGCERNADQLNGVNLTATGWDDDSHAYCKRLVECKSPESDEILNWLIDAMENEDAA